MTQTAQVLDEKTEQVSEEQQADARTQVQSAQFPQAVAADKTGPGGSIDILLDMNIPVTVALGQAQVSIKHFLQLGPGSVLKLDKSLDMPADLYIKDTKFAVGSIVVVEGQFGIKIQQIFGASSNAAKDAKTKQN
jgi:flagellar motor switch protein FliN